VGNHWACGNLIASFHRSLSEITFLELATKTCSSARRTSPPQSQVAVFQHRLPPEIWQTRFTSCFITQSREQAGSDHRPVEAFLENLIGSNRIPPSRKLASRRPFSPVLARAADPAPYVGQGGQGRHNARCVRIRLTHLPVTSKYKIPGIPTCKPPFSPSINPLKFYSTLLLVYQNVRIQRVSRRLQPGSTGQPRILGP
jgi:hypothetical protein